MDGWIDGRDCNRIEDEGKDEFERLMGSLDVFLTRIGTMNRFGTAKAGESPAALAGGHQNAGAKFGRAFDKVGDKVRDGSWEASIRLGAPLGP